METSRIVNKPFKPWKVVLELNEKLISGKDKIIIGPRVAPKSTYFCAPYMSKVCGNNPNNKNVLLAYYNR